MPRNLVFLVRFTLSIKFRNARTLNFDLNGKRTRGLEEPLGGTSTNCWHCKILAKVTFLLMVKHIFTKRFPTQKPKLVQNSDFCNF